MICLGLFSFATFLLYCYLWLSFSSAEGGETFEHAMCLGGVVPLFFLLCLSLFMFILHFPCEERFLSCFGGFLFYYLFLLSCYFSAPSSRGTWGRGFIGFFLVCFRFAVFWYVSVLLCFGIFPFCCVLVCFRFAVFWYVSVLLCFDGFPFCCSALSTSHSTYSMLCLAWKQMQDFPFYLGQVCDLLSRTLDPCSVYPSLMTWMCGWSCGESPELNSTYPSWVIIWWPAKVTWSPKH